MTDCDDVGLPGGAAGGDIALVGFLVDERPHVFPKDGPANLRFLESVDHDYWRYQSQVHAAHLSAPLLEQRQRAAVALRIAYGQAVETLFALIGAAIQAPTFPLGWLSRYTNTDLRSVVRKIHAGAPLPSVIRKPLSWDAVADAVLEFTPEARRPELIESFGKFWRRLATEFLDESFEPEYNSLKHGMRTLVGGFSIQVRANSSGVQLSGEGEPWRAGTEHGSCFWMPPTRVSRSRCTFELSRQIARAWTPLHFVDALPLIGLSIGNVASRARVATGTEGGTVRFYWPQDAEAFEAPWRHPRSIQQVAFGQHVEPGDGWQEPSPDEIRAAYAQVDREAG